MNTEILQSSGYQPRRKKYIDTSIQGRLIITLLILEVLIFSLAMWFVYQELQTAIDNNLYRVHQPDSESRPVLLTALLDIIPWILIINVLLLVGIDRIWGNYLAKIIEPLRHTAERVSHLDLRKAATAHNNHSVLEYAQQWTSQERERCKVIQKLVQSLPNQANESEQADISTVLTEVKERLPKL